MNHTSPAYVMLTSVIKQQAVITPACHVHVSGGPIRRGAHPGQENAQLAHSAVSRVTAGEAKPRVGGELMTAQSTASWVSCPGSRM